MGKQNVWQSLVWAAPAALGYSVLLPLIATFLDRKAGVVWPFPDALSFFAIPLLTLGLALALWSFQQLTFRGHGTPNPIRPPQELVKRGPYRWSRNPMMVGAWAFGAGLALVIGSLSLLVLYAVIVLIGVVYVRKVEEPVMLQRFGDEYRSYAARVPRWLFFN